MELPIYLHLGDTKILLHAIIEPIAFLAGFRYYLHLRKKQGDVISSENRIWIIIAAIFGALIGSRLVGGLEDPSELSEAKNVLLYFYQNKTVLGGFLGGLAGVEITKKIIGEKKASGDLFVYPIILALIIGRLGCFSAGLLEETYGLPTNFFLGVNLGDNIKRHPVTLYEIGFLILLWVGIKKLSFKINLANGASFKIFMIAYIGFRFFLDFIKPHYTFSIGLSTIQIACTMGLLWYLPCIINPKRFILHT